MQITGQSPGTLFAGEWCAYPALLRSLHHAPGPAPAAVSPAPAQVMFPWRQRCTAKRPCKRNCHLLLVRKQASVRRPAHGLVPQAPPAAQPASLTPPGILVCWTSLREMLRFNVRSCPTGCLLYSDGRRCVLLSSYMQCARRGVAGHVHDSACTATTAAAAVDSGQDITYRAVEN
jgi:hypothetical protein